MARPWRLAKSLHTLRDQLNARHPKRKKTHDGTIGDAAHAKRKSSDHNPSILDDIHGVVSALDITHDPVGGCDAHALAEHLRTTKDPRIKYIISNARICSPPGWTWRRYTGANPHKSHIHISVKGDKRHYDSMARWVLP